MNNGKPDISSRHVVGTNVRERLKGLRQDLGKIGDRVDEKFAGPGAGIVLDDIDAALKAIDHAIDAIGDDLTTTGPHGPAGWLRAAP